MRLFKILLALCCTAVPVYWWFSPYLALYSMKAAIKMHDGEGFNNYVDYPLLRESIKQQYLARVAQAQTPSARAGVEREGPVAGTPPMPLLDTFINSLVRPAFVMRAMEEAKIPAPGDYRGPESQVELGARKEKEKVDWVFQREGTQRFIAYGGRPGVVGKKLGFVFSRFGFASWRLTHVRLPDLAEQPDGAPLPLL